MRKSAYKPHRSDLRVTLADDYTDMPAHLRGEYAQWLVHQLGRPMERALIRAYQRYNAAKPARRRASNLHQAYRHRRR
jgi:hypothetical protein